MTIDELRMPATKVYCKQIGCVTSVCDWYECTHRNVCEVVKRFYRFIQTNDDPDDVQFIDGVLFYTTPNLTAPQLDKKEREEVAKRWTDEQQ